MYNIKSKMYNIKSKLINAVNHHHSFFSLLIGRHLLLGLDQLHHSGLNGFKSLLLLLNNLLQF
jgi:hypothetical protein